MKTHVTCHPELTFSADQDLSNPKEPVPPQVLQCLSGMLLVYVVEGPFHAAYVF